MDPSFLIAMAHYHQQNQIAQAQAAGAQLIADEEQQKSDLLKYRREIIASCKNRTNTLNENVSKNPLQTYLKAHYLQNLLGFDGVVPDSY